MPVGTELTDAQEGDDADWMETGDDDVVIHDAVIDDDDVVLVDDVMRVLTVDTVDAFVESIEGYSGCHAICLH